MRFMKDINNDISQHYGSKHTNLHLNEDKITISIQNLFDINVTIIFNRFTS